MESSKRIAFDFFPSFQNKDEYFEKIITDKGSSDKATTLYLLMNLFSFLYGLAMGSYHSVAQAIAAGIKVPLLFSLSLLICFPAFFIIQFMLGSRLKLKQMITIILSGFVLTTSIMVSFIPIVIFFLLTGGNYYFLQLMHITIFTFAGLFGMRTIIDALKFTCEKKGIYPKIGVDIFRIWVVILAIVGIQLAWNLRPFTGDKDKEFILTRNYEGNFYTAVIYSVNQLFSGSEQERYYRNVPMKESSKKDSVFLFRK